MRVFAFLKKPAWIILAAVVVGVSALFIRLGIWQLDRLTERRAENALVAARLDEAPVPLTNLALGEKGYEEAAAEYAFRRVIAAGTFLPDEEVLIRSQTRRGEAGFHVVTPLLTDTGVAILVNRGWVPLSEDTPPVSPRPPAASTTVELVLQETQTKGAVGPTDPPDGRLAQASRIDIARIAQQLDQPLLPVYGLLVGESAELPAPVQLPELDEGTHLSYAIQWFAFAAISVGGFLALVRTTARRPQLSSPAGEPDRLVS